MQRLIHGRRNRKLVELDKQVVSLVDAEARRVRAKSVQVFWIQMKIAASGKNQPTVNLRFQFVSQFLHARIVEKILVAGVRSSYNMGNPVGNRGFGHLQRKLEVLRAVVQSRKDMTMYVHHSLRQLP